MGVKQMTLTAYSDGGFSSQVGQPYVVMLNPEKLNWSRSIEYNYEQANGASAPSPTYKKTPSEKLSFELVIDCTGVVDSSRTNMQTEINQLSTIIYNYNGSIHKPNYVKIVWGSEIIQGMLTSYGTAYTLFGPTGVPLRARLSLEFVSYATASTVATEDKKQSPDMTHLVTVQDGVTLPEISRQIYLSPEYYVQIAQFNQLNKFRQLKTGKVLVVPPLVVGGAGHD